MPRTDAKIVVRHGASGVQVHGARLAAVMHVDGVRHILMFKATDLTPFDCVSLSGSDSSCAGVVTLQR